jgi:hypothetical protein
MPTALSYGSQTVDGIVLPWELSSRDTHEAITHFCGVRGESRIDCSSGGRTLEIPVLVYTTKSNTQAKLSGYLESIDNRFRTPESHTLVVTSEAGRPSFIDCSYIGMRIVEEPKLDHAGSLGGLPFATVIVIFRQHR